MGAEHGVVYGADSCDEVAVVGLAGGMHVVLASAEVPHQIAEIHVAYLIRRHIPEVLQESGLLAPFPLAFSGFWIQLTHCVSGGIHRSGRKHAVHRLRRHSAPWLVGLYVGRVAAVEARKPHVEFRRGAVPYLTVAHGISVAAFFRVA